LVMVATRWFVRDGIKTLASARSVRRGTRDEGIAKPKNEGRWMDRANAPRQASLHQHLGNGAIRVRVRVRLRPSKSAPIYRAKRPKVGQRCVHQRCVVGAHACVVTLQACDRTVAPPRHLWMRTSRKANA
jgi:hypothetical protein